MDQRQGSIFASLSSRAEQGAALLDIPWQKMSTKSSSALFPQRHMPRRLITVCGLIAVVIIMTFFGFSDRRVAPYGLPSSLGGGRAPGTLKGPTPAMDQLLRTMYRPNIMSVTEPSFTDENGTVYSITGQPEFKKSLGKKLLILDVDTRNMSAKGRMLDEEGVQWPGVQPMTAGILSHYLYSTIHGYDYKFIKAKEIKGRYVTWSKVPVIQEALRNYDYVVFLDQDAMFRYPTMPIEWLMNHWNHTKETLIMLSEEPDRPQNKFDDGKKFFYNTGFMMLKNTPRTHEIFDAWMACPDDKERFPGCHEYTYKFSHEQVALAKYVREMEFNRSTDIVGVPCSEANGSPYTLESEGCAGKLIRHLWMYGKEKQGLELIDEVMRYFVPILHDSFMQGIQYSYVDKTRNETL